MEDLDCYLFVNQENPQGPCVTVLCVECREEKYPDTGSFYEGSKEGYSDYDWKCSECDKFIHKIEEIEEENEENEDD